MPVRVSIEVLKQTQPQHELGIFGGPAEVRGISVFNQVGNEGEVHDGVDFPEEMIERYDPATT